MEDEENEEEDEENSLFGRYEVDEEDSLLELDDEEDTRLQILYFLHFLIYEDDEVEEEPFLGLHKTIETKSGAKS